MKRQPRPVAIAIGIGAGVALLAGFVAIAVGVISYIAEEREIPERVRIAIGVMVAALIGIVFFILLRLSDTGL